MIIPKEMPYEYLALAKEHVEKKTKSTHVLKNIKVFDQIPKFQLSELEIGRVLGRGGFGVVSEITQINLKTKASSNCSSSSSSEEEEKRRCYMQTHCRRQGKACRYALKRLNDHTRQDPTRFFRGVVDLSLEARFLSVLRHPHIITLRGVAATAPYDGNFFLVLDRLHDMLTMRLKTWKRQQPSKLLDRGGKKKTALYLERLTVAYDLSSALKYMHALNIMYRDVKPQNCGFDVRDEVKIFDCDLIREFDPEQSRNGTYQLTGQTGSTRYMAPEVALGQPYNESVDVYSFNILLWEILHLQTPFDGFTQNMFDVSVVGTGVRPKCDDKVLSPELSNLMNRGWHANWKQRPTMEGMSKGLRDEICRNGGKVIDDTERSSEQSSTTD